MADPTLIGAAVTIAGGICGTIKWAVTRLATSYDAGTAALVENAKQSASLGAKLDAFSQKLDYSLDSIDAIREWADENSQVGPVPRAPRTPAGGVPVLAPSATPTAPATPSPGLYSVTRKP